VTRYETLLVLHIASAFTFVSAYTMVSALLVACLRIESRERALALLRLARPADALAWVGATGTLVFGLWLVFDEELYDLLDGWVIGALVLWLVAEEAIRREDLLFKKGRQVVRSGGPAELRNVLHSRHAVALHVVGGAALLGILILMIYKPGVG
jgi:cytochrome c biogenesis factor